MKRRLGFTMIELIMVIVIIGIIAAFGLPKFANFKTQAIEKSEDYIAAALNTALKNIYLQNLALGSQPRDAWPDSDMGSPFSLLAQAPPNYQAPSDTLAPDGYRWVYRRYTYSWNIACPHRDGNCYDGTGGTKGRLYMYLYYWPWGKDQGNFTLGDDKGH